MAVAGASHGDLYQTPRPGRSPVWQVRIRKHGHPQRTHTFDLKAHAVAWAQKIEREMGAGVALAHDGSAERTLLSDPLTRYEHETLPTLRGGVQGAAGLTLCATSPAVQGGEG